MPTVSEVSTSFNPETCTLAELKAEIEKTSPTAVTEVAAPVEEPVAEVADPTQTTTEPEEDEETIYQRRIDLGDGSGVQVFQGSSLEELVDKLVVAQENATKKIRQLAAEKPPAVKKPRSADEEFVLGQKFMSKPSEAFSQMFEAEVGMPISEFKSNVEAVKAFNETKAADDAANKFVALTPDYFANPSNGKKIQRYLEVNRLPATVETLTKAYTELNADGLLAAKPAEKAEAATEVVTRPKPKSSGLSTRGGAPKPAATQPTEKDLYTMPLAQLRNMANKQAGTNDNFDF